MNVMTGENDSRSWRLKPMERMRKPVSHRERLRLVE